LFNAAEHDNKIISEEAGDSSVENEDVAGKYLIFGVAEFVLAVDISYLKKVYDAETQPPRTPDSKVVDLHRLTGTRERRQTGYWLDMDFPSGHFLVPVEEVEGISELGLAVPVLYPSAIAGKRTRFIKKMLFDGMRMISEINPEGISETPLERLGFGKKKKAPSFGSALLEEEIEEQKAPAGEEATDENKVLTFISGGVMWAINLDHVFQVINKSDIFTIPSAPPQIMGAIYHSEKAIPVIKPEAVLDRKQAEREWAPDEEFSTIILVHTEKGEVGIPCERVMRVLHDYTEAEKDGSSQKKTIHTTPAEILEVIGRE